MSEKSMVWIKGAYDNLLQILSNWYRFYDRGKVVSFRKVMNGTEEFVGIQPTERAVQLEISETQFKAIVDMMEILYPNTIETKFFVDYYHRTFSKGKLIGTKRLVTISVPKNVVKNLLQLFMEFKSGRINWAPRNLPTGKPEILERGSTKTQGLFAEFSDESEEEELEEYDE